MTNKTELTALNRLCYDDLASASAPSPVRSKPKGLFTAHELNRTTTPVLNACIPVATSYRPAGAARRYAPQPMAVRLAADLHPSADGSAVHTFLVAGDG